MVSGIKILVSLLVTLYSSFCFAGSLFPPSNESDYNYVGVRSGAVFPGNTRGNTDLKSVSGDTTYTAGIFLGRKINNRFSVEVEYMNRGKSDINSSSLLSESNIENSWSVKSNSLMLNLSADLMTGNPATPYIKVGIGASRNESGKYTYSETVGGIPATTTWDSKTVTKFAWQAGFGVNMSLSEAIDANIEYALVSLGEFKTKNSSMYVSDGLEIPNDNVSPKTGKLRDQVLTFGLRFRF